MSTGRTPHPNRDRRSLPRARAALVFALAATVTALGGSTLSAQPRTRLFIVQYDLVSQTPVDGGADYIFRARLFNFGPAIPGATARLVGSSTAGQPTDDTLVFGPVARNRAAWSDDTATFRRTGRWRNLRGDFRWEIVAGDVNRAPVANAGPDQPASPGDTVTLDGSGSTDADGDPLTYEWTLVSAPPGSAAVLENATTVTPQFIADNEGDYVVQLVVNDGTTGSAPDTVTISTQNTAPVSVAGPDQTVVAGQLVTLDGLASYDADGDPLTYNWSLSSAPVGSTATISDPTTAVISFLADQPGDYVLRLIVSDGWEDSAADSVTVSTTNSAPVANAGPDQSTTSGQTVMLDGTASSDADSHPLTYAWAISSAPAGSTAALVGSTTESAQLTPDVAGIYVVQLIVSDGFVDSAPDTVRIEVTPPLPFVTVAAIDAEAAELGLDPGVVRVSRSFGGPALSVVLTASGSASNGIDYEALGSPSFEVEIPSGQSFVDVTITPRRDNLVEQPDEVVTLEILPSGTYQVASQNSADVTIADDPPVVSLVAGDPIAAEFGLDGVDTGRFDFTRTGGDTTVALPVEFEMSGTATAGVDYQGLTGSPVVVLIQANESSARVFIVPIPDGVADANETATATLRTSPSYLVDVANTGTVTIR